MKVLRPEMEEINKRLPGKENAMKRQQETMAVQSKAGVSPLSGCIPALLQMPVFFALFRFFPSNIDLRQKGFLWAEDLSAYDSVFKLPFKIPMYGDHISLFPILASVAIFFYMRMSQSQQMNMQPQQEGMPDMQKMMKMMMYLSPVMMLIFFNMYASSLSLYYFVSNLLTVGIMLVIKNYIIDEDKIHAKIQENKLKPKKESKFRQKLNDAMKQAQEQQAKQQKKK
jgi:YidC/Oxa1 family membrane protein insertase